MKGEFLGNILGNRTSKIIKRGIRFEFEIDKSNPGIIRFKFFKNKEMVMDGFVTRKDKISVTYIVDFT